MVMLMVAWLDQVRCLPPALRIGGKVARSESIAISEAMATLRTVEGLITVKI